MESRRRVYEAVRANPGIHAREVVRRAGIPAGTVKYHLAYLSRHGLIKEEKDGNLARFFPSGFGAERQLMGLLRQHTIRKIMLALMAGDKLTHERIVGAVGLSPSTVSWHLRKLEGAGVVGAEKSGRSTLYRIIADKEMIIRLLITYRESFLDSLVEHVIEMWE